MQVKYLLVIEAVPQKWGSLSLLLTFCPYSSGSGLFASNALLDHKPSLLIAYNPLLIEINALLIVNNALYEAEA